MVRRVFMIVGKTLPCFAKRVPRLIPHEVTWASPAIEAGDRPTSAHWRLILGGYLSASSCPSSLQSPLSQRSQDSAAQDCRRRKVTNRDDRAGPRIEF